jgi:Ion channel
MRRMNLWDGLGDEIDWVIEKCGIAPVRIGLILMVSAVFIGGTLFAIVEPDASLIDGWYWATVVLPTVGFGDYNPTTTLGRAIYQYVWLSGWLSNVLIGAGFISAITAKAIQRHNDTPEVDDDIDALQQHVCDALQALKVQTSHPLVKQALHEVQQQEQL